MDRVALLKYGKLKGLVSPSLLLQDLDRIHELSMELGGSIVTGPFSERLQESLSFREKLRGGT